MANENFARDSPVNRGKDAQIIGSATPENRIQVSLSSPRSTGEQTGERTDEIGRKEGSDGRNEARKMGTRQPTDRLASGNRRTTRDCLI